MKAARADGLSMNERLRKSDNHSGQWQWIVRLEWIAVVLLVAGSFQPVPATAQQVSPYEPPPNSAAGPGFSNSQAAPVVTVPRAAQQLPPQRGPSARYSLSDRGTVEYPSTNLPPWQEMIAPPGNNPVPSQPMGPPASQFGSGGQAIAERAIPNSGQRFQASPIPISEVPAYAVPEGAVVAGSFGPESGPRSGLKQFDDALVMAIVGDQYILAGDIEPEVDLLLAPYKDKMPAEDYEAQRQTLIKQVLKGAVDTKIVYLDFLRTAPADRIESVKQKIDEQFDKRFPEVWKEISSASDGELEEIIKRERLLGRLVMMMQKEGITSMAELDGLLRRHGSSLSKQRRNYQEQLLSQEMIRRNINLDGEITHAEMIAYFENHSDQYEFPARARWEQLTARFDRFPSRDEAFRAIAYMGDQVYLEGAPFGAVARRFSHGSTAAEGGQHDWTNQGSLASKELDAALFEIELNKLSPIIEDRVGFHIIRVLAREPAGRKAFGDVQKEIEQKIRSEARSKAIDAYMTNVKKNARVWTIYDEQPEQTSEAGDSSDDAANQ